MLTNRVWVKYRSRKNASLKRGVIDRPDSNRRVLNVICWGKPRPYSSTKFGTRRGDIYIIYSIEINRMDITLLMTKSTREINGITTHVVAHFESKS